MHSGDGRILQNLAREEIMMRINLNLCKERGLLAGNIFCGFYREKEEGWKATC